MGNRIYLASPTMHQEEQVFIQEAFDTNWVAPLGKNVDEFEKGVAEFVGVKSAAALNAGTAALHLAVKLAGVRRGDKVFCSDLTFSATVNPVSYEGGEQVFIDSERETWNMDPRALERAFERYPDCRCVIAANLYGTPAKLDEIRDICDAHGAVFIEDAAESLSATYKGRVPLGSTTPFPSTATRSSRPPAAECCCPTMRRASPRPGFGPRRPESLTRGTSTRRSVITIG